MNYNLSVKEDRIRFVRRANSLLKNKQTNICLVNESNRTLNQNNYIHVLCKILAADTGQTAEYAKQVYFKELANPDIFITITKDPITSKPVKYIRSTGSITVTEMQRAIVNFRNWAAENGYYLPEADISDDGTMSFTSDVDKAAFNQAIIETSKIEATL